VVIVILSLSKGAGAFQAFPYFSVFEPIVRGIEF